MPYEKTTVDVGKSQQEIRGLLWAAGADELRFMEARKEGRQIAAVEFLHHQHLIRMHVPLADVQHDALIYSRKPNVRKSYVQILEEMHEQEAKRIWRVLKWTIKAKLEAITEGLVEFDQEFLPFMVDPETDMTVWERLRPSVYAGRLHMEDSLLLLPEGVRNAL